MNCTHPQSKKDLRSYLSLFAEISDVRHTLLTNDTTIIENIKNERFDNFIVKPTCGVGSGGVFHLYRDGNNLVNWNKFKGMRNDNLYITEVATRTSQRNL